MTVSDPEAPAKFGREVGGIVPHRSSLPVRRTGRPDTRRCGVADPRDQG